MFPDLPKTKGQLREALMDFFQHQVEFHSNGIIKDIPKRVLHEGDGFIMVYEDGMLDDSKLNLIQSSFTLDTEKLLENPDELFIKLNEMAQDQAIQQLGMVVSKVSELTEKIGNVTKYHNELTPNDVLDSFEKITMDFNADGTPRLPQIYGGEGIMKALPGIFESIDKDPVLLQRFRGIINKQRENWHARASNRKLVD